MTVTHVEVIPPVVSDERRQHQREEDRKLEIVSVLKHDEFVGVEVVDVDAADALVILATVTGGRQRCENQENSFQLR